MNGREGEGKETSGRQGHIRRAGGNGRGTEAREEVAGDGGRVGGGGRGRRQGRKRRQFMQRC